MQRKLISLYYSGLNPLISIHLFFSLLHLFFSRSSRAERSVVEGCSELGTLYPATSLLPSLKAMTDRRFELGLVRRSLPSRQAWISEVGTSGLAGKKAFVLLAGLLYSLSLSAVSDQERWLQAQALTQQQDFAGAAQQYQALQHKTAPAWYNLANCVYQLKDALSALVLWRRAQMQELRTLGYTGPVYRAAAQNILYTQARLATSNYQFDVTRAKAFGIGALTPVGTKQQLASAGQSSNDRQDHTQSAGLPANVPSNTVSDHQSDVGTRQRANGHSLADNGPGATASGPNLSSESNLRLSADNFVTQKLAYLVALYHSGLAWITKISQQTPLIFLQLILLILWFSLSWVLYRVYINFKFTRKLFNARPIIKFMGILILSLLVVLTAQLLYRKQQFNQTNWGVVIKPTQLYLGPGTDYPLTAQLTAATYVKILAEKRQSWYAVQTEDRQLNGWITASDLVLC